MARKIVAGNWKMNLLREEAQILVSEILGMVSDEINKPFEAVLIPPYVHIGMVSQMLAGQDRIRCGAQNCSEHIAGAYTGEISATMLKSTGCRYVLAGHSERRLYFGEDENLLSGKIDRILEAGMTPVYCFGETIDQREGGKYLTIIEQQLSKALFHLSAENISKCILAYEPVWAIGTGKTASPEQAQEVHAYARQFIGTKYGREESASISILYGGSCNDQNAAQLFALPDVDGGLIGGASLKSRSFVNIIKSLP